MLLDILKVIFIFLILDYFYLNFMKKHFQSLVKNIQNSDLKLKILPTVVVYLYIIASWYYFIYEPKIHMTKKESVINAFVLGFLTYGIYDFTNMAIFEKWDIKTAMIDNIWGGILYSIPAIIVI